MNYRHHRHRLTAFNPNQVCLMTRTFAAVWEACQRSPSVPAGTSKERVADVLLNIMVERRHTSGVALAINVMMVLEGPRSLLRSSSRR